MNLNDFVVLPNNKARSVKLNARNLQELHMETVTLAQESKEMEEKLQQLKENMGKEKKERGHSGGFRWISGQCGPLNSNTSTNSTKKNSKDRLQKMSAGKVKIRMLKDEPLTAPPPPPASTTGFQTTTKNRLRGTICGQCEVKSAGLMCAECTENYCISCFAKFHQKGALKLHRMILIQADLKTHVSTLDVVSSFQKQIDNSLYPSTFTNHIPSPKFKHYPHPQYNFTSRKCDESPEKVTEDVEKPMPFHPDPSKALVINEGEKKKLEITKEQLKRKDAEEIPESLLRGEFSEEESARSFQEALRQWREEKSGATGELTSESAMWIPARPVSVSAIATQVDLPPDRGAQGRVSGRGIGRIPVMVEFTESSVTYMDRLLLKKHRRTPVEPYHTSQGFAKGLKSLCNTNTEEESANSLTAQDLDFHHYCASLFAVSLSMGREKPQITTPESCLVIEVLDEVKMTEASSFNRNFCKQTTDEDNGFPSVQQVSSNGRTLVPQTTLTSAMPSKNKPSACPTAEAPRTLKTSIKTPTSKSQSPNFSPIVHKSNHSSADHVSPQLLFSRSLPQFQTEIPKFSHFPTSCSDDVSSVQTVRKGSESSPMPEQPHSSMSLQDPISSTKVSQSPPTNLEFLTQSQHSLCVQESLPSDKQLQHPLSLVSSRPNPQPKSLEPSPSVNTLSGLCASNKFLPDTYSRYKSSSTHRDVPLCSSRTSISAEHKSTLSNEDTRCIPSDTLIFIQNPPSTMKMEDDLSVDSGDEISSDSLGLAPHEGDSSEKQAQMHRHTTRGRSRGEEQGNPATSYLGDSFVPADTEREEVLLTDEPEQLSEPSMVLHSQRAGSGSELLCDMHEFTPLGLDVNSGHSDTPEHRYSGPLHTCQTSLQDSNQTGSEDHGPGSSTNREENLIFNITKDSHTASTGGGEKVANELSGMVPAFRPLSRATQEIMEICNVDQMGCEDPDLDTDTTAHTLHSLEQELRLLAKETGSQASAFGIGNSGIQNQCENQHFTRSRVSEKQKEDEEAAQRDLQSVLLLS
ncbi:uncharacterized protein zbbx isoform X2 [Anabas testudineus]|uniref:uncharacterized protein zbbx isoform X2 n=1 Tax=Anabas testudineus TaxID=64144 RepID=UPI000E45AB59|nr:uncharacterized protein zbbx isoform X2 [Anabas testudineus]